MSRQAAQLPWIEKYRPRKLDDVVHQDEVTMALKNTLQTGNLPHLLFYGPPGTGKTSTILAVARELYGPNIVKDRILELNASHERGIDVIRDRVKTFAQIAINHNQNEEGYPVPPFKIVILDEADCMTKDAQSALRRTMENYAHVTRFCIICNYVSRIINPITSRCAKFRFKSVSSDAMLTRLGNICTNENILYNHNALQTLMDVSAGDMRRSITLLQTASIIVGNTLTSTNPQTITSDIILEVCGSVPENIIVSLWQSVITLDMAIVNQAVLKIIRLGYPLKQILNRLVEYLMQLHQSNNEYISDISISQLMIKIANVEERLLDGATEVVQLLDVMSACVEVCATK